MKIGVEISLYPLTEDYIPPIRGFIDRLNADGRFKVVTNDMSTQVFGAYDDVMEALTSDRPASPSAAARCQRSGHRPTGSSPSPALRFQLHQPYTDIAT